MRLRQVGIEEQVEGGVEASGVWEAEWWLGELYDLHAPEAPAA